MCVRRARAYGSAWNAWAGARVCKHLPCTKRSSRPSVTPKAGRGRSAAASRPAAASNSASGTNGYSTLTCGGQRSICRSCASRSVWIEGWRSMAGTQHRAEVWTFFGFAIACAEAEAATAEAVRAARRPERASAETPARLAVRLVPPPPKRTASCTHSTSESEDTDC